MYAGYGNLQIPGTQETVGTGWLPPLPDLRDYTVDHPVIAKMAKRLGGPQAPKSGPQAPTVDLRPWCSPIWDQGNLGSCSAHAAAGIVEYYEIKAFNKYIDVSRRFIYKTTRELLHQSGNVGAQLRNAMGALVLFGWPLESFWPYTTTIDFDDEPPAFIYAMADNYESLTYFRHDPLQSPAISPSAVLASVRKWLAWGIPAMFGFVVFQSWIQSWTNGGKFPYPCTGDNSTGQGHAVVAVGYDDNMIIQNTLAHPPTQTKGALLIRNSWGTGWGTGGYGWLPYKYVLDGLAWDFWSLLSMEWVDSDNFGI